MKKLEKTFCKNSSNLRFNLSFINKVYKFLFSYKKSFECFDLNVYFGQYNAWAYLIQTLNSNKNYLLSCFLYKLTKKGHLKF